MTQELFDRISKTIQTKIDYLNGLISDLRNSNSETKSSMGDKYETSREMMQQEITRIQNQLNEVLIQQEQFQKIKPITNDNIGNGSYVETTMGNFCIACSLGEINYENKKVFVMSNQTPLAQVLLGKRVGENFEMNGKKFEVNLIL
ncbi:hypothetical protein [Faecalibacter rhinopitheci]|uniref:3-oxoacyl-ACP synthase n=1 Tax=Faecalibacter rhinopitheci TaxID=2779678 RepID=A0A8J7KI58_9FLAO|nr:hypothetical protein [Faecalibacter rhinopitheci]MBF0597186.1 hypothetical protein [Faecalibacter rhinopitheci]MBQ0148181.1 hypothetical protein [Candidatus Onthonaster equi]